MYANFQGDSLGHNSQHGGQSMEDVRARYWTRAGHEVFGLSSDWRMEGPSGGRRAYGRSSAAHCDHPYYNRTELDLT